MNRLDQSESAHHIAWKRIVLFSLVGFFSSLQPSEAFLTRFLRVEKNLTEADLDSKVWPSDAFAALCLMPVVTVLSDVLGQRFVIGIGLIAWHVVCILLIFASSVEAMIAMQVFYALSTSARVFYLAQVYSVFAHRDFDVATAFVIGAHHFGSVIGSGLGQLLVQFVPQVAADLTILVWISWAFLVLATLVFLVAFPSRVRPQQQSFIRMMYEKGWRQSVSDVRQTLSFIGWQWLAWWCCVVAAYEIYGNYFQLALLNVGAQSFGTLAVLIEIASIVGALAPILVTKAHCGESLSFHAAYIALTCVGVGLLIVFTAVSLSLLSSYAATVGIFLVYSSQESCSNVFIAGKHIDSRPALVFGIFTFLSLAFASMIQAGATAAQLNTTQIMYVCATLYFAVPVLQGLFALCRLRTRARKPVPVNVDDDTEALAPVETED